MKRKARRRMVIPRPITYIPCAIVLAYHVFVIHQIVTKSAEKQCDTSEVVTVGCWK